MVPRRRRHSIGRNSETNEQFNRGMRQAILDIVRLLAAAVIGDLIGYERRMHHKAIGIAGMMLIAIGSTSYMLLAAYW